MLPADLLDAPPPPYVVKDLERERWRLAVEIAARVSALYEADGEPSRSFVWSAARSLYHDETIETGSPIAAGRPGRAR